MTERTLFNWKAEKHEERLEEVLKFIADRLSDIDVNIQKSRRCSKQGRTPASAPDQKGFCR
jgi:hypothetical protein